MSAPRRPVWSDALTLPLAAVIPVRHRAGALRTIKVLHTAAFVAISAAIVVFAFEGLRGRRGLLARSAASVAVAETIVYVSNNQVCPLTPLAEQLGATSGSVTDLYLPARISARIPVVGGSVLCIGFAAHLATWRRRPGG